MLSSSVVAELKIVLPEPNWRMTFQPVMDARGAPQLAPSETELVHSLRSQLDAGDFAQARQQLLKQWPEQPSAALWYIRAQIEIQVKQYQQAEQSYQQAIATHGPFLLAAQSLAGIYLSQQKLEPAHEQLTLAIELGGASADLYGQLGYLNLQHHSAFSAIAAYQNAYSLAPKNKHWQQGLLLALSKSGAYQQASKLADELLQTQQDDADLWLHKANAALSAQQSSQALSALEVAIRLGETQAQNIELASRLNLQAGNIQRAIALVEGSSELMSDYQVVKPMLAWLAQHQRWRQLAVLVDRAQVYLKRYQSSEQSHFYTQKAKLARARKQDASGDLRRAIDRNPSNGEALVLQAEGYRQADKLVQADLLLIRAGEITGYEEVARLKRVQLAYQQMQYQLALELLNEVLRINPSRRDLLENIDTLKRLLRQQALTGDAI